MESKRVFFRGSFVVLAFCHPQGVRKYQPTAFRPRFADHRNAEESEEDCGPKVGGETWETCDISGLPSLKLTANALENGWLEDYFPFGMAYFQVRTVSFREGIDIKSASYTGGSIWKHIADNWGSLFLGTPLPVPESPLPWINSSLWFFFSKVFWFIPIGSMYGIFAYIYHQN